MLQTRNGKRTAMAALKFSMDMVKEKLIDWETAILRNSGRPARPVARARVRRSIARLKKAIAAGLVAGPARLPAKSTNADRVVVRRVQRREGVARPQTKPAPKTCARLPLKASSRPGGVLRTRPWSPARWARFSCVAPARWKSITTRRPSKRCGQTFSEGDYMSIDGTSGTVYGGPSRLRRPKSSPACLMATRPRRHREVQELPQLMKMVSRSSRSAPTPTRRSRPRNARFGATARGLTRTEHMFFEGDRIDAMREMILAENVADRKKALAKPFCINATTSRELSKPRGLSGDHPFSIRRCTKSVPHEPSEEKAQAVGGEAAGVSAEKIAKRVEQL